MATRSFLSYVFCWHNNESIGCIHITTLERSAKKNSHHMDTIRSHTRTRLTQTHLVKFWWVSATHHAHRPTHTHIWCGIKLSLFESFLIPISDRSCSWWYMACSLYKLQTFGRFNFFSRFASAKLWNFTNFNRSILHAMASTCLQFN